MAEVHVSKLSGQSLQQDKNSPAISSGKHKILPLGMLAHQKCRIRCVSTPAQVPVE
jgi:hypothetical protein